MVSLSVADLLQENLMTALYVRLQDFAQTVRKTPVPSFTERVRESQKKWVTGRLSPIGQVVGREQQKINNLEWAYLTAEQWSAILKEFKNFYVTVSYPDMVNNTWTERKMYPGDRTAEPFHLDPVTQLPLDYINCKVNLIDCGEPF